VAHVYKLWLNTNVGWVLEMAPSASGFQVVSLVSYPQFAKIKDPVLVYSHGSQQYNIIKYLFINQQFFAGSFEVCEITGTGGFFFLIFFFSKNSELAILRF